MIARQVLSMLFLVLMLFAPIAAEARCASGNMCWERQNRSYHSSRWDRSNYYHGSYYRYGNRYNGYGGWANRHRGAVVQQDVVHEPGLVDYVVAPPLAIINGAFGLLFGRTHPAGPPRDGSGSVLCADDDIACRRTKGREDGRHDGKSAVATIAEDEAYRQGYNDALGRTR